ncbi:hypothetical protein M9H77_27640 [Catharanthus roseus]|uniref:Uncharacterized protein n=1 Tax=Catharanthus roseus TaxID=4058 RepID=A0ACC0AFS3_CATRO|nr:hypothetical protein M9H77_27640 [Catharanthus roseus]
MKGMQKFTLLFILSLILISGWIFPVVLAQKKCVTKADCTGFTCKVDCTGFTCKPDLNINCRNGICVCDPPLMKSSSTKKAVEKFQD